MSTLVPVDFAELFRQFELLQFSEDISGPLFDAIAKELQELDDSHRALFASVLIANASGARLDQIGRIVIEPRNALGDDDYRARLLTKIQVNAGNATNEDIIFFVKQYSGAVAVRVLEVWPAGITVEVQYPLEEPARLAAALRRVKPGGVELSSLGELPVDPDDVDYTVADETERLGLTVPPLEECDLVLQEDTGSIYKFDGGDPTDPSNWVLVGPPFVFDNDPDFGEGFSDLSNEIGGDYVDAGVLGNVLA